MKIQFLKNISKTSPSLARLIEVSIISWAIYVLWAISSWDMLDPQALSQAMLVPIVVYLSKLKRDLDDSK